MPHLPYPSYKDTDLPWLGRIPAHWEVQRLKNALSKNDGGVWGDDSDIYEEGTIVLRSTDVGLDGSWIISDPAKRKLSATEFESGRLIAGDLLVTKSSGSALHLGKTALVTKEVENLKCCFSNFMQRLRANENFAPEYIYWILNSSSGREQLNYFGSTTTGLNNLTGTLIGKLFIAYPPLPEQRTIAAYLDRQTAKIDALIARKQRLLNLLAEKRAALIDHSVTKGINPKVKLKDSGLQWLGKIPEHWDVIRSKRLFGLRNTKALESEKQLTVSQEFGVMTQEEFMAKGSRVVQVIKGADILKHVEPNDFIISMRSFQGGIEWSKIGGSTSSAYVVLVPNKQVHYPFYAYLLKCQQYIQALQSTSNLIRDGQALRYANFCLIDLPVVPLAEQREIADFLDSQTKRLSDLAAKIETAIASLREYRAALISSVVTGKVQVNT